MEEGLNTLLRRRSKRLPYHWRVEGRPDRSRGLLVSRIVPLGLRIPALTDGFTDQLATVTPTHTCAYNPAARPVGREFETFQVGQVRSKVVREKVAPVGEGLWNVCWVSLRLDYHPPHDHNL